MKLVLNSLESRKKKYDFSNVQKVELKFDKWI